MSIPTSSTFGFSAPTQAPTWGQAMGRPIRPIPQTPFGSLNDYTLKFVPEKPRAPPPTRAGTPISEEHTRLQVSELQTALLLLDKERKVVSERNVLVPRINKTIKHSAPATPPDVKAEVELRQIVQRSFSSDAPDTSKMATEDEITKLRTENDTLRDELGREKHAAKTNKDNYDQAQQEIEDKDIKNQKLEKELDQFQRNNRELTVRLKRAEDHVKQAKNDYKVQEKNMKELQRKLDAKEVELNDSRAGIKHADDRRKLSEQAAANNLKDSKGIRENLKDTQAENENLKQENETLRRGLQTQGEEFDSILAVRASEIQELRESIDEATATQDRYDLDPKTHMRIYKSPRRAQQNLGAELAQLEDDSDDNGSDISQESTPADHGDKIKSDDLGAGTSQAPTQESTQEPIQGPAAGSGDPDDSDSSSDSSNGSDATPPGSLHRPGTTPEQVVRVETVHVQSVASYRGVAHDPFRCWFQTERNLCILIGNALLVRFAHLRNFLENNGLLPATNKSSDIVFASLASTALSGADDAWYLASPKPGNVQLPENTPASTSTQSSDAQASGAIQGDPASPSQLFGDDDDLYNASPRSKGKKRATTTDLATASGGIEEQALASTSVSAESSRPNRHYTDHLLHLSEQDTTLPQHIRRAATAPVHALNTTSAARAELLNEQDTNVQTDAGTGDREDPLIVVGPPTGPPEDPTNGRILAPNPTSGPRFWPTFFAFLLHVLVYWVTYAAFRERQLWVSANGDARNYFNRHFNPFLNNPFLYTTSGYIGGLLPPTWRRPIDAWYFETGENFFGLPSRYIPG